MPEDGKNSFREMNVIGKAMTVIGIIIMIILVLGLVIGIYFFGIAGIFELLGVQYNSIWSLVIFVVSFFILGIFVELFSKALFKLFVQNIAGDYKVFFIRMSFEFFSNWLILFTVDEFVDSITLSGETEIITAIVLAVLEIVFDNEKDDKDRKEFISAKK